MKIKTIIFLLITTVLLSGCRFLEILESFAIDAPAVAEAPASEPAYPASIDQNINVSEPTATPFAPAEPEASEPTLEPSPLPPPYRFVLQSLYQMCRSSHLLQKFICTSGYAMLPPDTPYHRRGDG